MISVPNSNMRSLIVASLVAAILMCSVLGPNAQPAQSVVTDPLQGFSQDRDQPLKVEGPQSKLQLTPVIAIATYGRYNEWAKVVLGNTTIKCRFLTIHYAQEEAAGDLKAAAPFLGHAFIRKLELSREITIAYRDQTVTADDGILDMRANLGTLTGDVVLTRGRDVLRGGRLVTDLAAGTSRMEPLRERR